MEHQSTIPELCGVAQTNAPFRPDEIAAHLQEGLCSRLVPPCETWAAAFFEVWRMHSNRVLLTGGQDAELDLPFDMAAMAELFSSTGWRELYDLFSEVMLLGWSDTDKHPVPREWRADGWWETIAICLEWKLVIHEATDGMLIRVVYSSPEDYTLDYWLAGYNK